ncbi:MAG: TatD family hydrolase [Deltaproteobacteria bacterium]|nr:TatD family hydrolase [Deltaproteobacteria bacterium]
MIDSHCHLDNEIFASDREAVLSRARAVGINAIVVPAVDVASWQNILKLAQQNHQPQCYVALGLHPVSLLSNNQADDLKNLIKLDALARTSNIVAIGECGLDASIDLELASFTRQEIILHYQIDLAFELDLPLILHARGKAAYRRLAALLNETGVPNAGAVIHSYSGGVHMLSDFQHDHLYFGVTGPVTYPDTRRVHASVQAISLQRLLIETDAPDQTPVGHRPGRCEPAYLNDIAVAVATIRNKKIEKIKAITQENTCALFRINPLVNTP